MRTSVKALTLSMTRLSQSPFAQFSTSDKNLVTYMCYDGHSFYLLMDPFTALDTIVIVLFIFVVAGRHVLLFEDIGGEYNIPMAANAKSVREFDDGLTRVSFGFKSVNSSRQQMIQLLLLGEFLEKISRKIQIAC
ncbi:hypothetical protein PIB30_071508 [Stylosanthes scabra]|uniref:Uncharacterized protein n=1 Tax=Stylosanthes scabra TaxID=79078 RepID=A0ABU6VQN1_9FABA|nr:hypothetical protein [Stylosanthes scabra]